MKINTLAAMLLVFTAGALSTSKPLNIQQAAARPQTDIEKLEAQFKELDEEYRDIRVDVSGDKESSGKISIEAKETDTHYILGSAEAERESGVRELRTSILRLDLDKIDVPDEYIDQKIRSAFSRQQGPLREVTLRKIVGSADYEVAEDYTYDSGAYRITALKGFRYDRASIPRIFWVIIDKDSLSNVAPLFHDLLYRNGGELPERQITPYRKFTREDTDALFYELMGKCGVTEWRRKLAYDAVRHFAGRSWKKRR